jgi:signal transduction histidine kinase
MLRNRIVTKLGGTIIILFFIVLLPLGFVMNQIFSNFYTSQVQKDTGNLALRYAETIASRKDAMTVGMIEMMSAFSDMLVVITDEQGKVIGNAGMKWVGDRISLSSSQFNFLAQGGSVQIEMSDPSSEERFLGIGQPITDGSSFYGSVFVFSSVSGLDQSLQNVRQLLILSGVGAFFLALGFTFIVSKKLSSPLIQMEQATRRIAKGELETRVAIPSNDEVGSLAKAVNDLAMDLQRYRDTRREFLANVSHELRTPMTYLEGYAKVLKDGFVDSEEEKEKYLDIIYQETLRLSRLIHDLFELSKMEEGKISLQQEWLDISDLIRMVVRKVEPKAIQKGLTFEAEIPDQVPLLFADGFRMEQILMNLMDNAIRYTEHGVIGLKVLHRPVNHDLTVVIEDTGVGIPEDELPYIFERFYRVEKSRSREFGGTGLGLAIVKQLVELQGGTIHVVSQVQQGTRFELIFPLGGEQP